MNTARLKVTGIGCARIVVVTVLFCATAVVIVALLAGIAFGFVVASGVGITGRLRAESAGLARYGAVLALALALLIDDTLVRRACITVPAVLGGINAGAVCRIAGVVSTRILIIARLWRAETACVWIAVIISARVAVIAVFICVSALPICAVVNRAFVFIVTSTCTSRAFGCTWVVANARRWGWRAARGTRIAVARVQWLRIDTSTLRIAGILRAGVSVVAVYRLM